MYKETLKGYLSLVVYNDVKLTVPAPPVAPVAELIVSKFIDLIAVPDDGAAFNSAEVIVTNGVEFVISSGTLESFPVKLDK
jgi:hypothetical protein